MIPLYNKKNYIDRALNSVFMQKLPATEIIVVDDGSEDAGAEKANAYQHLGVIVVVQKNAGPGAARNRGVADAKSEWVAFLDADDYWHSDHLFMLSELIKEYPQVGMVSTSCVNVEKDVKNKLFTKRYSGASGFIVEDFFRLSALDGIPVNSSSVAVNKRVFIELGGFKPLFRGEDIEFWSRLALFYQIAICKQKTAFYDTSAQGISCVTIQSRAFREIRSVSDLRSLTPVLETLEKYRTKVGFLTWNQRLFVASRLIISLKMRFHARDLRGIFIILMSPRIIDIMVYGIIRTGYRLARPGGVGPE